MFKFLKIIFFYKIVLVVSFDEFGNYVIIPNYCTLFEKEFLIRSLINTAFK